MTRRQRQALRARLKRALVAAGVARIASRRAIRAVIVLLALERA